MARIKEQTIDMPDDFSAVVYIDPTSGLWIGDLFDEEGIYLHGCSVYGCYTHHGACEAMWKNFELLYPLDGDEWF